METLRFDDVENSLLPFRVGRRLILDRILELVATSTEIQEPVLFLSRLFVRLKSADSILEKIRRKSLPVQLPGDIPAVMDDILGFRLIAENQAELRFLHDFLIQTFKIKSISNHPQNQQFGGQSIDYSLVYEHNEQRYPFEVQLRTFLQHYWASNSFFLFHKTKGETALPYQNDLLALSSALHSAEESAEKIQSARSGNQTTLTGMPNWQAWPLRTRVHLILIKPHEQFEEERIVPLGGDDENDHNMLVRSKMACYEQYPNVAVVECMCANIASFLLNEPQVHVGPEYLNRVVW